MSNVTHNPVATFLVDGVKVHEAHGHDLVEIQSNVGFADALEKVLNTGGTHHREVALHVMCPCGTNEVLCRVFVSAQTLHERLDQQLLGWQQFKAGKEPTMEDVIETAAIEITEIASKRLALLRQMSWLRLFFGALPRTTIFRVH